jgi:hypothetical protein
MYFPVQERIPWTNYRPDCRENIFVFSENTKLRRCFLIYEYMAQTLLPLYFPESCGKLQPEEGVGKVLTLESRIRPNLRNFSSR